MPSEKESTSHLIELWNKGIETQMHFAELSIKMRQLGFTLAGATLALAVVTYRGQNEFALPLPYFECSVPIASLLCVSAGLILYAAKTLDADMYHRMLRGAVKFNELIELEIEKDMNWAAGLTETISAYSRYKEPRLSKFRDGKNAIWQGETQRLAKSKISFFYWLCISALLISAFGFFIAENPNVF